MYPLAIIAILLGLLATFSFVEPQASLRNHSERALAVNFCIYRTAVSDYVRTHPDIASVPANAIELPTGYRSIRNWQRKQFPEEKPRPLIVATILAMLVAALAWTAGWIAYRIWFGRTY